MQNLLVKVRLMEKLNWVLLTENGKYYKIGLNVLWPVEEVNLISKECVSLLKMEVNHAKVILYKKNHVMNNHVTNMEQMPMIKIDNYQLL
jgi:hypothetical protein